MMNARRASDLRCPSLAMRFFLSPRWETTKANRDFVRLSMPHHSENSPTERLTDSDLYRLLPSVNELLLTSACQSLLASHPRYRLITAIRANLSSLRQQIA